MFHVVKSKEGGEERKRKRWKEKNRSITKKVLMNQVSSQISHQCSAHLMVSEL